MPGEIANIAFTSNDIKLFRASTDYVITFGTLITNNNYDSNSKSRVTVPLTGLLDDPSVLIEGVLFRARYLGSTQLVCEGQPTKSTRMCQAEEAVSRIKHGYGRCSVASQGSIDEDECDSSEELIGSVAGGGQQQVETQQLGSSSQTSSSGKLAPIGGSIGPSTVFRLHFLGSVEVEEEGGRKRRKRLKKHMVEEAVTKIKVRSACP
ncbi:hypothetical protein G9C98_002717 [Cotesia typhae]|uniref:PID domain-containing protein n=1 Tax=Cotesia typhae TaxID=2053667 RepID=A0A8J5QXH2_9HYME|nr:hypothetical protein G9C98_002717 [Cotesia typhae]